MGEVPRPLEVVSHDDQGSVPVGRKKISAGEQRKRAEQLMAQVVAGEAPLDANSADVIREYLDAHHARQ
jgi:hypothetical protein